MADSQNTLLESFKNRQADKNEAVAREAFRLVSLYRSLSCFGADFVDKYNQMLLAASPAVRRLLSTFMGGEEVEDYLEFLQQNSHFSEVKTETQDEIQISNKGYLPSPESDAATEGGNSTKEKLSISVSDWEKMNAEQKQLKEQVQFLLNELGKNKRSATESKAPSTAPFNRYSEIVGDSTEEKKYE